MQGEPSPAAVSLFVPVALIVPLPRSVATHAQWAPLVSIVMFWAVIAPAQVASRPRKELGVVAIVDGVGREAAGVGREGGIRHLGSRRHCALRHGRRGLVADDEDR